MIRIAVCDGDPQLFQRVRALTGHHEALRRYAPEVEHLPHGDAFRARLEEGSCYAMVLMHMALDGGRGVELGRCLRRYHSFYETLLVYLAGPEQEDLHGPALFETCPFQLLAGEISDDDLLRTLLAALDSLRHSPGLFLYRKNRAVYQVRKRDIVCLESVGRYLELTTADGGSVRFSGTMKKVADQFGEANFIRPHLSFLVNLDHVESYHTRHLVLQYGLVVPISEKRADQVRGAAMQYWKESGFSGKEDV